MSDIKGEFIMSKVDLSIYGEMMGEVIANLKNEIKELTFKVQKAREECNWGTYRNLVIAYKEVIQLYKEIVDKISEYDVDNTQYIKNNTTIGLDENTSNLINEAFVKKEITIDNIKDMYIDVVRINGKNIVAALVYCNGEITISECRRVGKECRSRWARWH